MIYPRGFQVWFDRSWSLSSCKRWLTRNGHDWRKGYFEFDGAKFSWTPMGSEQHERTANPFG